MAALILGGLVTISAWRPPTVPDDRLPVRPALPLTADPSTPLRLSVFGTSLTAGADWPEAAATALGQCLNREVRLARVARNGANVSWALDQLASVRAGAPDIVIVEFAINDADIRDGLALKTAMAVHLDLIDGLRLQGDPVIVLMTMNPAHGPRGWIRPRLGAHYAGYATLAGQIGVGLVDLYPRWRALPRAGRGLDDGLHPTNAAARAVILPVLVPYLGRLFGAGCPPP